MRTRAQGLFVLAAAALSSLPTGAYASFLPPELMDSAATYLAWFILIVMPIGGVALFWMVHVLPEKIAEKRHHPQTHAIQVLCLLSLVFGGLLWPIAWLWAYTKPVSYRLAYGTDKNDEYFEQMAGRAEKGEVRGVELQAVLDELDGVAARNALSAELRKARDRLAAVAAAAGAASAGGAAGVASTTAAGGVAGAATAHGGA